MPSFRHYIFLARTYLLCSVSLSLTHKCTGIYACMHCVKWVCIPAYLHTCVYTHTCMHTHNTYTCCILMIITHKYTFATYMYVHMACVCEYETPKFINMKHLNLCIPVCMRIHYKNWVFKISQLVYIYMFTPCLPHTHVYTTSHAHIHTHKHLCLTHTHKCTLSDIHTHTRTSTGGPSKPPCMYGSGV